MKLGYARVSTEAQDNAAQLSTLKKAGCRRVFEEKASGGHWERPELQRVIEQIREGDELIVWKLDRLSRSPKGCRDKKCDAELRIFTNLERSKSIAAACPIHLPCHRRDTKSTVRESAVGNRLSKCAVNRIL